MTSDSWERLFSLRKARRGFHISVSPILFLVLLYAISAVGQVSFIQTPKYSTGYTGNSSPGPGGQEVAADFNGDGKPDLALGNGTLLLNNGDGTFRQGTSFGVQGVITAADFNGDGKQDLAVWTSAGNISILLGKGDGTFQSPTNIALGFPAGGGASLVAVDLGSGNIDLVMPSGTNNGIWVLVGNGHGGFAAPVTYPMGSSAFGFAIGDFNGDHKLDVVNPTQTGVAVLLGNGDGTFNTTVVNSTFSTALYWLIVGDFNGDGMMDIAGITGNDTAVGVALGNGNGTFQNPSTITLNTFVATIGAANFVPGGPVDIAAYDGIGKVQILQNDGHANLSLGPLYGVDSPSSGVFNPSVVTADFNGDGKPDIVVSDAYYLSVLLGKGDSTFQGVALFGLLAPWGWIVRSGDFNGDGKPDLAAFGLDPSSAPVVDLYLGNGDGTFTLKGSTSIMACGWGLNNDLAVGDFNGDGNLDVVASCGQVELLLGNGDGTLQSPVLISAISGAWLAVGDFNGDKKPDVAATSGNNVEVFLGNGDGTFQSPATFFVGTLPGPIVAADATGDGKLDIVSTTCWESACNVAQVSILAGNGDGTFQAPLFINVGQAGDPIGSPGVADFNSDGIPDLAVPDLKAPSMVEIFLGGGGGKFKAPVSYPYNGSNVLIADFNGDGKPDLAGIADEWGFGVVLGNGDGTFAMQQLFVSDLQTLSMTAADFNLDGKPDIAVAGSPIAVLLNKTPSGFRFSASALSPASVAAGGSATSTITMSPAFGFNGSVNLSCTSITLNGATATIAPPSCAFNPLTITNGSGTSTLTVSTTANSALLAPSRQGVFYAMVLPLGTLMVIGAVLAPTSTRRRKLFGLLILGIVFSGVIGLQACGGGSSGGGGSGGGGTSAGSYTITITGKSGSTNHTATVTLTVQ